jgi:hypothetical protein
MNHQFQGKPVSNVRDARQGDQGFQQGGDQVVITLQDGTQKTVKRSEVTQGPQGQGQSQGQR